MPSELAAMLSVMPPWVLLAVLVGVMTGCACFMLVGRRFSRLPWYAVIAAPAAGVGQVFGMAAHAPAPLLIGELNVAVASLAACCAIGVARLAGL